MKKYWWLILFFLFIALLSISKYQEKFGQKYESYTATHSLIKEYSKEDYERAKEFSNLYHEENTDKNAIINMINSDLEVNAPTYFDGEYYADLPLCIVAFEGDYETAEHLIKKGAVQHVSDTGRWPILCVLASYEKGDLKFVKLFLSNGANEIVSGIDISEEVEATSPYKREGKNYTKEEEHEITFMFKELLNAGALVDQQVVVESARYNNVELLDYFIEQRGMDINVGYTPNRWTDKPFVEASYSPLIAASDNNSIETARYLIEHGADKNIKNNVGKMAIDYAKTDEMWALLSQ